MNKDNKYFLDGYRVRVVELEEKIKAEKERKKQLKKNKQIRGVKPQMKINKYQADKHLSTAVFLREQIKYRCLSYRKLATMTGVNYNVISRIANGELPTLDSWQQVCCCFELSKLEILEVYEQAVKESLVIKVAKEKERYNKIKGMVENKENIIGSESNENNNKQEE